VDIEDEQEIKRSLEATCKSGIAGHDTLIMPPLYQELDNGDRRRDQIQKGGYWDDFMPSWYHLALDRDKWRKVCVLAEHETRGDLREAKAKKSKGKADAKAERRVKEALIWSIHDYGEVEEAEAVAEDMDAPEIEGGEEVQ
tara:strand:- start:118 stop:540 length:423 start_codon:yes stop_codon:yes gene_type:complete